MIPIAFWVVLKPQEAHKSAMEALKSEGMRIIIVMMHFGLSLLLLMSLGILHGDWDLVGAAEITTFVLACIIALKAVFHLFCSEWAVKIVKGFKVDYVPALGFLTLLIASGLITLDLFF